MPSLFSVSLSPEFKLEKVSEVTIVTVLTLIGTQLNALILILAPMVASSCSSPMRAP